MRLKYLLLGILVFNLIFLIYASSTEVFCGSGQCEAGYYLTDKGYLIKDITTCYDDCQFTDWVICEVDVIRGGECYFNERLLKFYNLERTGCGATENLNLAFDLEYEGHKINFPGRSPNVYFPAIDDVSISYKIWPCAVATTKQIFYIKGNMDRNKFENFMDIKTKEINLKEITDSNFNLFFTFDYDGLSNPRLNLEIKHYKTDSILASIISGSSPEQRIIIYPNSTEPGKYIITAKIFDNTDTHLISEQISEIIINECYIDNECDDGKFWTKNLCFGDEYNLCSNPNNNIVILSILLIVLVIFILFILVLVLIYKSFKF